MAEEKTCKITLQDGTDVDTGAKYTTVRRYINTAVDEGKPFIELTGGSGRNFVQVDKIARIYE